MAGPLRSWYRGPALIADLAHLEDSSSVYMRQAFEDADGELDLKAKPYAPKDVEPPL